MGSDSPVDYDEGLMHLKCPIDLLNKDLLLQIVPSQTQYKYKIISIENFDKSSFESSFHVNLKDEDELETWLSEFHKKSAVQFTTRTSRGCTGRYLLLKREMNCIHNVQGGKIGARKHTGCPTSLRVVIRPPQKRPRTIIYDSQYPCEITLKWCHNHAIYAADVLRHQRVLREVDLKLENLFRNGHSPSTALECMKMEIEDNLEEGDGLEVKLADRSICPDYSHCHYVFKKLFRKEYGDPGNNNKLDEFILKINEEFGEKCVASEDYQSSKIVAICTPFMKRVHKHIEESGELVFVDSSGGMVRDSFRIFLLMTRSKAGALPLAVGITPAESEDALNSLFKLVKTVIPGANSFQKRGSDVGPQFFMTDDSAAEQAALVSTWPQCKQYLCQFHILQAVWRWLLFAAHRIDHADRPLLFTLTKKLMYADTELELRLQYELFQVNELVLKYKNFMEFVNKLWKRRTKWCSAFRSGKLLRGNNTNNYAEASMRILKDQIFHRTRAFNLVQIVQFISTKLSSYYERRLMDFSANRLQRPPKTFPKYEGQQIVAISEDVFQVESSHQEVDSYTVNIATNICTCHEGCTGKMCKHMFYVLSRQPPDADRHYHLNDSRELMYLVACGHQAQRSTGQPETSHPVQTNLKTETSNPVQTNLNTAATSIDTPEFEYERDVKEFHDLLDRNIFSPGIGNEVEILPALRSAIESLKRIATTNSGVSALRTFGKYSGVGASSAKKLKLSSIQNQDV